MRHPVPNARDVTFRTGAACLRFNSAIRTSFSTRRRFCPGYIVERRDPAAVADRLLRLFGDAELRRRMGDAGRRAAEQKFDLQRNVQELIRVYGLK
jgi:glycosyltransferase involved in cell wall biosynthesis